MLALRKQLALVAHNDNTYPRLALAAGGATPPSGPEGPSGPDLLKLTQPGYIIRTRHMKGMSEDDLAERTGIPEWQINFILKGHKHITPDIASALSEGLGMSAMYFMNLRERHQQERLKHALAPI